MRTTQILSFHGPLLQRGFWLYAWEVAYAGAKFYYVGRTGDSSSKNASSPFNRVGMHFDIRPNAKANSLLRRLRAQGVPPEQCEYRMAAVGPLYPEQDDFLSHKPYRDIVATLEYEVASTFRDRGLHVLGEHHRGTALDEELFATVLAEIDNALFIAAD